MKPSTIHMTLWVSIGLTLICCASTDAMLKSQDEQSGNGAAATPGQQHLQGALTVLEVKRWEDLAVVRLQNGTRRSIECEYRPRFLHRTGIELGAGEPAWQRARIPTDGVAILNIRIPGSIKSLTESVGIDVRQVRR